MSRKRITHGEVDRVPKERTSQYNWWSMGGSAPLYHGAKGYVTGVDFSTPIYPTLQSARYIEGLRSILLTSLPLNNTAFRLSTNNTGMMQSTHYQSPFNAGLKGQTVVSLAESTVELDLTGSGNASMSDYDPDGSSNRLGELLSYTDRYRLSSGLNSLSPKEVLLSIPSISRLIDGINPLNVWVGDEIGLGYNIGYSSLESLVVPCTIGRDNPVYIYTKTSDVPMPSDVETCNTPVNKGKLFLRSNTTEGSVTFTDESPSARTVSHSGVEHTTSTKLFGSSSIQFNTKDSYIKLDNIEDDLAAYGDFTLRVILRSDSASIETARRLFYFDDNNYLDLISNCGVEGIICGKTISGHDPNGDWQHWTPLCIMRKGPLLAITINGRNIATANTLYPFGASRLYTTDRVEDGNGVVTWTNAGGEIGTNAFDHNNSTYWLGKVHEGTSDYPQSVTYKFNDARVIRKIGLLFNSTTYHPPYIQEVLGSNDDVQYDKLLHDSSEDPRYTWNFYEFDNQELYSFYRYTIVAGHRGGNYAAYLYSHASSIEYYEEMPLDGQDISLYIGSADSADQWSFTGQIEEFQFFHEAIPDTLGKYANNPGYTLPGLSAIKPLELYPYDRAGYKLEAEEYSIIGLTGVTVVASNEDPSYIGPYVIEGDNTSYWDSGADIPQTLEFTSVKRYSKVCRYTIQSAISKTTSAPSDWTFEGYDGTWNVLDTRSGVDTWTDNEIKEFVFLRTSKAYNQYRLNITAINGASTICIAEVDIYDQSRMTVDTDYVAPTEEATVTLSGLSGGERHISSNTEWSKDLDTSSVALEGSLLSLPVENKGQIYIDNTGRLAQSNALVRVDNISWIDPPKISQSDGTEISYIFLSNTYSVGISVDTALLMRVDLPANALLWLEVDHALSPASFLISSDVFQAVSTEAEAEPYMNLKSVITGIDIDSSAINISDGNFAEAELCQNTPIVGSYIDTSVTDGLGYAAIEASVLHIESIEAHNYLWVSGGTNILGGVKRATTKAYDIVNQSWTNLADCPVAHAGAAVGQYMLAGKLTIAFWYSNTLYEYDVETNIWSATITVTNNSAQTALSNFTYSTYTEDSKFHIYMYGGLDSSGLATDQWIDLNVTDRDLTVNTLTGDVVPAMYNMNSTTVLVPGTANKITVLYGGTDGSGSTNIGTADIQSNVLRLISLDSTSNASSIATDEVYTGDVTFEADIIDATSMTLATSLAHLTMYGDDDNRINIGLTGDSLWRCVSVLDGTTDTITTIARANETGKLKLARTGDSIVCSYDDGGGYTILYTFTGYGGPVHFVLGASYDTSGEYITLDNPLVDSGAIDTFTGVNGDPADPTIWATNSDLYDNLTYADDVHVIDTEAVTTSTPSSGPVGGPTSGLLYIDTIIDASTPFLLVRDKDDDIFKLDLTAFTWSSVTIDASPALGSFPIFSIGSYQDIYDVPYILTGYGVGQGRSIGKATIYHHPTEVELALSTPTTPTHIQLSFEYASDLVGKMDVRIMGYDTEWHNLSSITSATLYRTGKAYKLDTALEVTKIKVLYYYGAGTSDQQLYLTGVSLLSDLTNCIALDNEIDLYESELEVVCVSNSTDVRSNTVPKTSFRTCGFIPPTTQTYTVKELDRTGIYQENTTALSYPYSARFSTTDYTRIELDLDAIDRVETLMGGDTRLALSFDDRVTWNIYNSGWSTIDITVLSTFRTSGMTESDIASIPTAAWDTYFGADKYMDVAVLLTIPDADSRAYFNTISFVSDDKTQGGRRVLSPQNNWLNVSLNESSGIKLREYTDIVADTASTIFNCYDWSHGSHNADLNTTTAVNLDIKEIYTDEECEGAWIELDEVGNIPSKLKKYIAADGSNLRREGIYEFFDYSTETRSIVEYSGVGTDDTSRYRRGWGKDGTIIMTYGNSSAGYTEIIESATRTLYQNVAQTHQELRGNGATLAGVDHAWLTPGNYNPSTLQWYNSITRVDYSTRMSYYHGQRCNLHSNFASGCGGVSDLFNGWILGQSTADNNYYSLMMLQYATDTAGVSNRANIDVSTLDAASETTIGCSSSTLNSGYFLINRPYASTDSVRPLIKIRYSNDTAHVLCRTTPSVQSDFTDPSNPQARSVGNGSIYFWTNNSNQHGPLALDLSTDTAYHRSSGVNNQGTSTGSYYCGTQTNGVNY